MADYVRQMLQMERHHFFPELYPIQSNARPTLCQPLRKPAKKGLIRVEFANL